MQALQAPASAGTVQAGGHDRIAGRRCRRGQRGAPEMKSHSLVATPFRVDRKFRRRPAIFCQLIGCSGFCATWLTQESPSGEEKPRGGQHVEPPSGKFATREPTWCPLSTTITASLIVDFFSPPPDTKCENHGQSPSGQIPSGKYPVATASSCQQ
jgi:hypothetical protein